MAAEIKPLVEVARGGLVMVGNPSLPAKTLPEVIGYVKANPGKVSFASYTAGTLSHVMGLQLNKAAGIDMLHVGYKGSTPALQDLMGGHVQLMFDGLATSIPLIKAGKIKAFAVSMPQALAAAARGADLRRARLPAARGRRSGWACGSSPTCRRALQAQIREAALKAIDQPALRERLMEVGFEPGQARTPEQLGLSLKTGLRSCRRGAAIDRFQAGVAFSRPANRRDSSTHKGAIMMTCFLCVPCCMAPRSRACWCRARLWPPTVAPWRRMHARRCRTDVHRAGGEVAVRIGDRRAGLSEDHQGRVGGRWTVR